MALRESSRQPARGASGASSSSSSSASSPPRQDGGAPRKIPSDGGGSDVSCVVREFSIDKIRASSVVVVDPLASPPMSPPSDARRALLAVVAPTAKQLRLRWCDEKLTSVIRNYESPVPGVVCCPEFGILSSPKVEGSS